MGRRHYGFGLGLLCLASASACTNAEVLDGEPTGKSTSAIISGQALLVNECRTGTGGFIELFNAGTSTIDLTNDPASCFFVDDINGGGAPKRINDTNVTHAATSTTCSAAGRSATCALVAPGEHVSVAYSYVNATTADQCRLLSSFKSGTTCGTSYVEEDVGGATASTVAGQCFGRQPSGGAWQASAIACTQNAANGGGCTVGASCNDNNACTTGETYQADCTCGGGSAVTCDDGNACTTDACDVVNGCGFTNVADGTSCGGTATCQAGVCTEPPPPPPPPGSGSAVIVRQGRLDRVILRGVVVTPDVYFTGEVLVESDTITCVDASCAAMPAAVDATIVDTQGIIAPGLIDTHNHILYDIFDETDWSPTKAYANHNQWTNEARYKAVVDAKQYLNGEGGSPVSIGCEMLKYGELKGLMAGTTSIVGAANPADKQCYGSLARTIDQGSNDLGFDKMQVATLFPQTSTADAVCNNFASGSTTAYLVHAGEGVDATSLNEFDKLFTVPTTDGCLHAPQTTIVHGTAFGAAQFANMGANGMSLVWSPRSNVFLYGAGTDLTKTTNIPLALSYGINVALAPDWSMGGSQNLLDELRFADQVDNTIWGNVLTPKHLMQMVTTNAAKAMHLEHLVGSIAVGKKADIVVYGGDSAQPYDALLAAKPKDVRLVMVGGVSLYGDAQLKPIGPVSPGCEDMDVCGGSKFVCVAEPGGTASNKLGQTLSDITNVIGTELASYDNQNLTPYKFAPVTPLVKCQ